MREVGRGRQEDVMQARMETVTCFDNGHIVIMMRIIIILSIMIIGAFEKFLQVLKRIQ